MEVEPIFERKREILVNRALDLFAPIGLRYSRYRVTEVIEIHAIIPAAPMQHIRWRGFLFDHDPEKLPEQVISALPPDIAIAVAIAMFDSAILMHRHIAGLMPDPIRNRCSLVTWPRSLQVGIAIPPHWITLEPDDARLLVGIP
jgi:hypothetical protein